VLLGPGKAPDGRSLRTIEGFGPVAAGSGGERFYDRRSTLEHFRVIAQRVRKASGNPDPDRDRLFRRVCRGDVPCVRFVRCKILVFVDFPTHPPRGPPDLVLRYGPEIVDIGDPNGPLLPQSPLEKVGCEAPHPFQWVLR
jgi:hypothetical protein